LSTADDITRECAAIRDLLLAKNLAYGDSAFDPVRIFSQADPVEQIRVRIDDKLSRLGRGKAAGEDVEQDLLGYLVLLRIARKRAGKKRPKLPPPRAPRHR
jgi:hypothetical protein